MSFTKEHIPVLERHQHHWEGLRDINVMVNLDGGVITDLQRIYNEAVGPHQFTRWCADCIADLVRQLYTNYDEWKQQQPQEETPAALNDTNNTGTKRGRKSKNQTLTDGN